MSVCFLFRLDCASHVFFSVIADVQFVIFRVHVACRS